MQLKKCAFFENRVWGFEILNIKIHLELFLCITYSLHHLLYVFAPRQYMWFVFLWHFVFLFSQRFLHFLTSLLVFSKSNVLIVLIPSYPLPSFNFALKLSLNWGTVSNAEMVKQCIPHKKYFFVQRHHTISILRQSYHTMIPILFCYFISTFMFFLYSLQIINILVQISCKLDESIILEHNPSFVKILLGNSKKSYASIFLFSFPRVLFSGEILMFLFFVRYCTFLLSFL